MSDHVTLRKLLRTSKAKAVGSALLIGAFIAVATLARLLQAYDDFRSEAFSAEVAILLLIAVNIVVIGIAIAVLVALLKPPNKFAYAFVVILSWPVIVAAPIGVATITGTEVPGKPESVKISDVYNPWENELKDEIDEPVKKAKAREIQTIVVRYENRGTPGKRQLLDRLDESLSDEGLSEDEIAKFKTDVETILKPTATPYRQRLRQVARRLYAAGQREAVKDLGR